MTFTPGQLREIIRQYDKEFGFCWNNARHAKSDAERRYWEIKAEGCRDIVRGARDELAKLRDTEGAPPAYAPEAGE